MVDPRSLGARCDLCPLKGNKPVFASLPKSGKVRLVIVGESPGRKEEIIGQPFVGATGALLDQELASAGISTGDAWVTNAALCRGDNDDENDEAAACCAPRLLREIAPFDVPILALGKNAAKSILGISSILLSRGFVWTAPNRDDAVRLARKAYERDIKNQVPPEKHFRKWEELDLRNRLQGRVVFPTVHPAFVLRSDAWRSIFAIDIRRLARWLAGKLTKATLEDNIKRVHSFDKWVLEDRTWMATDNPDMLMSCFQAFESEIAIDIETDGINPLTANIVCVGISDGFRSLVIDPWQPSIHAALLTKLCNNRRVVMHNGFNFDQIALGRDGVGFGELEDTLLAHHAFASHFPQKLDQLVSEFCDFSPWKIRFGMRGGSVAEKGGLPPHKMPAEERDFYCACDCVGTILSWHRMQNDLADDALVYTHDKDLAALCKQMQVEGIEVDNARRLELSDELRDRKHRLEDEMREILKWPEYNPNKPVHVRKALYEILKAPILGSTPKGLPGTGEAVLEALAGQETDAGRFSRAQMTWRLVSKIKSTYVDPVPLLSDGRAHYNWKPQTVSGRLSSRVMSCPRYGSLPEQKPRELYIASRPSSARLVLQVHDAAAFDVEGKLVYFDLAQAEARFAAYLSGDDALIAAVSEDIHTANALVVFAGIKEAEDRLRRANLKSPSGAKWKAVERKFGGCKEERDVTKNAGFCVWYCGTAETAFANLTARGFPVSLRACNVMVNRFHDRYWKYYKYVDGNLAMVRKQGFIRTAGLGRFRWLGYFPSITDVSNFPIQAGIADAMNERLLKIEGQARKMTRAEDVKDLIVQTWAEPVVLRKGQIVSEDRSFVLPAEVKVGERWSDFG